MNNNTGVGHGLTIKILLAMFFGAVLGLVFFYLPKESVFAQLDAFVMGGLLETGGKLFVNGLKMLVVPLVFVSLVCGVCSIGANTRIGVISVKTLAFYLATTAIAITLAVMFANIIDPGKGEIEAKAIENFVVRESPGFWSVLQGLVPQNIVAAMAEGKMLQIIVFAILFGIGLSKMGDEAEQVRSFFYKLDSVIMELVMIIMKLAPIGVFCLIATMFAKSGLADIGKLWKYFFTVLLVLMVHLFFSYGLLVWALARLNPVTFFKKMNRLWLFGFSTASSNASIPVTLETVEGRLGVKNEIASFTVPLGATINMDGTAIMQGVATVFIAQYYNINIGLEGYLMVILTATLASIGTAGVPGVGLIMLTMVLGQVGLPVEGVALIIGVDRLLDMTRTAVNMTGDSAASLIIAKSEGMLDEEVYHGK